MTMVDGLPKFQAQVLEFLMSRRRAGLGEIAQALGKDKAQVRRALQSLMKKGLVLNPYRGIYEVSDHVNRKGS